MSDWFSSCKSLLQSSEAPCKDFGWASKPGKPDLN